MRDNNLVARVLIHLQSEINNGDYREDKSLKSAYYVTDNAYNLRPAIMFRIKPEERYILSCGKGRGQRPRPFPQLRMQSSEGFLTD